ncbi:hypothetical protein [Pseudomonas sp. NPDC087817]|uniref:hypothetical protein n=1 Tax=Pseudomonas sp. NPDC087817 TaxID=3364451 RepID=UPI003825B885
MKMPHLHDMEELVNNINDNQVKDYMKEAMSCYMTSAYRACIVLTYIALFDDIVKKLGELGKVNKKAKKIHDEAMSKINGQDVYESYVIDQLKSNSLLPALDTTFLDTLRVLRNKSAHPSGHHASAEEARFIFFEAINRFLSKPILTTTQLIDELLARLDGKHFFPSTDIYKIASTVNKELINTHTETYPYLINKFLEKTQNPNADISKNAGFFLTGLAYTKSQASEACLKKYVIDNKSSDSNYSIMILRLISANGKLVFDLDQVTYDRLKSILNDRIKNVENSLEHTRFSHPASALKSILLDAGEDTLLKHFSEELKLFIGKNVLSNYFIAHIKGHPRTINLYFDILCKDAGSNDFSTANHISRNIRDIDAPLAECLSVEQSFTLFMNIISAASRNAWGAASLRDSRFSSLTNLKKLSLSLVTTDQELAKLIVKKTLGEKEDYQHIIDNYLLDPQPEEA